MIERMPRTLIASLLLALVASPLAGQVGHDPDKSPYRDILRSTFLLPTVGYFNGEGGKVEVGPHEGMTFGLQYQILANKPVSIGFGILYGDLQRLVQDPTLPPETRTSGPISHGVLWTDIAFQFNLTGNKSWHGLAPFLGSAVGLAFTEDPIEDQTGFDMGTRLYIAPMAGTRFFVADRLHLHAEVRFQFWQIKYPESYRQPPRTAPESPPVLPDGILSEWVVSTWFRAGLGWSISMPF